MMHSLSAISRPDSRSRCAAFNGLQNTSSLSPLLHDPLMGSRSYRIRPVLRLSTSSRRILEASSSREISLGADKET